MLDTCCAGPSPNWRPSRANSSKSSSGRRRSEFQLEWNGEEEEIKSNRWLHKMPAVVDGVVSFKDKRNLRNAPIESHQSADRWAGRRLLKCCRGSHFALSWIARSAANLETFINFHFGSLSSRLIPLAAQIYWSAVSLTSGRRRRRHLTSLKYSIGRPEGRPGGVDWPAGGQQVGAACGPPRGTNEIESDHIGSDHTGRITSVGSDPMGRWRNKNKLAVSEQFSSSSCSPSKSKF